MKVAIECYICLLERAIRLAKFLGSDDDALRVAKEISRMLIEKFDFDQVPAVIGTLREKIIMRVLNNDNPYHQIKIESNKTALKVAEKIFREIDLSDTSYENFRRIMIIAAAANAMEWFIRGHEFSLDVFEDMLNKAPELIEIDDTRELYDYVRRANTLLYVLDNAGEAVIDKYVAKYLRNFVKRIYVGARSRPILNDITVDEARELGFHEVCDEIVPVGDFVGIILENVTEDFRRAYRESDVVIAKGMGAYESITEYKLEKPVFVILKAKCITIAKSLGIPQGKLAIKRIS